MATMTTQQRRAIIENMIRNECGAWYDRQKERHPEAEWSPLIRELFLGLRIHCFHQVCEAAWLSGKMSILKALDTPEKIQWLGEQFREPLDGSLDGPNDAMLNTARASVPNLLRVVDEVHRGLATVFPPPVEFEGGWMETPPDVMEIIRARREELGLPPPIPLDFVEDLGGDTAPETA